MTKGRHPWRIITLRLRGLRRPHKTALAGLVLLAAVVGLSLPFSCEGPGGTVTPLKPPGVSVVPASIPTMRIRVTPGAVESAALGSTRGCTAWAGGQVVWRQAGEAPPVEIRRTGPRSWVLGEKSVDADVLDITADGHGLLNFDNTLYRGSFRLNAQDGLRFIAVNRVDLESYLAGVLSKELLRTWSGETYKALAIAARSFAYYQHQTFGREHDYDVTDDQGSQVYGGYSAESSRARQAVEDTWGQILVCDAPGGEGIFLTQYSACCGGIINDAAILRDVADLPPLRGGRPCTDCSASSRYRWPPVRISKADMYRSLVMAYPAATRLGGVKEIRPVSGTSYGRVVWIDVVGPANASPLRIRVDDLRLAMLRGKAAGANNLYSMNCQWRDAGDSIEFYDGRGFGHGVGLCQWGAEGKARSGWTAQRILEYYYPMSRTKSLY